MHIIKGDLLDVKSGLVCHQVNCQRVAGAGLALGIRQRWPLWYQNFKVTRPELGTVTFLNMEPNLWIANLYAQEGYGREGQHTNYQAFRQCARRVAEFAPDLEIYLPVGIGCGLAGGDWRIVQAIIAQELPQAILIEKVIKKRNAEAADSTDLRR